MKRWPIRMALIVFLVLVFPYESPAPLVYRAGEGWVYESPGSEGKWTRIRAKDQMEVAQQAFDQKKYSLALKAARRTLKVWPLSDYAPKAQYLIGRCYEEKSYPEKAFKEYQTLVEKYPKVDNYDEIVRRQFDIANRFLAGKWFRLWGYIPFFPSMDKTVEMYEKLIKNGPYSPVAAQAQLKIGAARERQVNVFNKRDPFRESVKAYEKAADRYNDNREIAAEAVFLAGRAYAKQAQKADYDQSVAGQAIATLGDFVAMFPNDPRVPEAQKMAAGLKTEQARGAFATARFYEQKKRWNAALIYYNEAALKDPSSPQAAEAKKRMEEIRARQAAAPTAGK
jgi:outer membrane protein assembly factor BamD (BamD/ComL family)